MQTRKEDRPEIVVLCKFLDSHKKCKDSVKQLLKSDFDVRLFLHAKGRVE